MWTKEKQKEYQKKWEKENPEKKKESSRRYYLKHKKQINEQSEKYRKSHLEKFRKYSRKYNKKYPEKAKKCLKKWREKSKEMLRIFRRKWKQSHPEENRHNAKRYTARKKGAEGSHTLQEWLDLKKKHNYCCVICKTSEQELIKKTNEGLTEDHKIPLTKNGTDYIWNIQPLCRSCNSSKGNEISGRKSKAASKTIREVNKNGIKKLCRIKG